MAHDLMYIELKTGYSDDGPMRRSGTCKGFQRAERHFTLTTTLSKDAEGHIPIPEILKAERRIGFPA